MKSSSSSANSTSETPPQETQLLPSSSAPPAPLPRLSLQSPELQAAFLRESQNKVELRRKTSESSIVGSPFSPLSLFSSSSPPPSPFTPSSSPRSSSSSSPSPSPHHSNRPARLSLSSPELLSELKQHRRRSLHHVPAHNGMTTVFSGRGRGGGRASGSTPTTQAANQKASSRGRQSR
ncbi:uncharacterized protein LOC114851287 [Betta splendens]|uniref:Uncharacterized protein LOC114851287 n=1 Tax=Betta splendens TaxID=158456 RepID=A0A6P7LY36_BETSP|nr:uncharacterized protein LOC114851287 [Betta splendens]XP_028998870.1 uncharacterized protein LOC114851287 [Betta splendens]XP_028998871.1 uncharacterized protein LOC114851287 [Betta splendens]XP_028998872.1 uncharacterized protein LOC114851287 [Betta splendens]